MMGYLIFSSVSLLFGDMVMWHVAVWADNDETRGNDKGEVESCKDSAVKNVSWSWNNTSMAPHFTKKVKRYG